MKEQGIKIIAENRKARHDFHIHETYETGIELTGTEVKSLRAGKANLKDSYAVFDLGVQLFLDHLHISPYEQGNIFNHDPLRRRRLLMHRAELDKLYGKVREKGYTLVPLKLYFTRGKVKVQIALASGKKLYDKRQDAAERDSKRDIERAVKDQDR